MTDISSLPQHAQDSLRPTPVTTAGGTTYQVPAGLVAEIQAVRAGAGSARRRGQSATAARMVSELHRSARLTLKVDDVTARFIVRQLWY